MGVSIVPKGICTLIIGTFPPYLEYKNNNSFFFYSSVRNHFWNRIENIFPGTSLKKTKNKCENISPEENKKQKEYFSEQNRIGFVDIFSSIKRQENTTKDEDIIPITTIVENSILYKILEENLSIKRICCTYKLAFNTLIKELKPDLLSIENDNLSANGQKVILNFNNRELEIFLLFPATRSREKGKDKDEQYKKLVFFN